MIETIPNFITVVISANPKKKWYKKRRALCFNYMGKGIKREREDW
jgi:hypothetical protein